MHSATRLGLPPDSNFWYNSLSSICTCLYLIEGPIVFHSASSSKLNFRFVGRLIVNHCECHNSVIRNAIEVHELLMESLFDKLSNKSGHISISRREGLQIIKICCCCFWWVLRHRRGHVIHTWDPGPSWRMPQSFGEEFEDAQERPPPWPPP